MRVVLECISPLGRVYASQGRNRCTKSKKSNGINSRDYTVVGRDIPQGTSGLILASCLMKIDAAIGSACSVIHELSLRLVRITGLQNVAADAVPRNDI